MPDPRQKLYSALSSNFDLGSQEEFNSKMDNPESRKKLYSAVSSKFDLGSFEEFESKVAPVKKKDVSNGTVAVQKSVSEAKTGSSAGNNTQGFPEIDTNSVAPGMGVQPKELLRQKSVKIKALENSFYEATKNNDDDAVAEQRTQEAINKEGIWNTIKDVSKKVYNTALKGASYLAQDDFYAKELAVSEDPLADEKKQVKTEALKNKEKLTQADINTKAAEIFKQKEKDNLFVDRANSFLDNLDPKDKELLRQDRATKATHLQESNTKKLKVVAAMQTVANEKIKEYKDLESQLTSLKRNNQELPENLYQKYASLGSEIKAIGGNIDKYQNEILKNKSDLGTAQEELDLFNREYGDIKNFVGNLAVSAKDLATGLMSGYLWFGDTMAGLTGKHEDKDYNEAMDIASKNVANQYKSNEKDRETLRKPVDGIESIEGFVNYASDLVANQIPNLAVTASGAKGLALIGTASAGQKFSEMKEEVRDGKAEYSPSQMAFAPLLYGGAEVISEIPTLSILKKGGRVFESIARNEAELLTKTAKQKAVEWAKDYGVDMSKEMAGEQFTNFAQNFNDKYVLGKNNVGLLDNTGQVFKDTFTLTSILKSAPHVFGVVVKPFQSKTDLGKLDENSRKIIEFSKQLDTEGLSETEKSVIQTQINKATAESAVIMKNTVGKIADMPTVLYDEVVSLNQQAGKIKNQAIEINEGNLSNKEELLKSLNEDYKAVQDKRNSVIEGKTTEVDVLPLKEQETLKKQAMEDLVTELNPDGSKDITITNEQVVQRANEILEESRKNEVLNTDENKANIEEKPNDSKDLIPSTETNETAPTTNPVADGNIQPGTDTLGEVRAAEPEGSAKESIPEAVDGGTSETKAEIKPISVGKFDYRYDQGEWKATDKEGNPVSNKDIPKKVQELHADSFDFTQGETALDKQKINDVSTWEEDVAAHSDNPVEVAETLLNAQVMDATEGLDTKSKHIAEAIGGKSVERSSFAQRVGKKGMKDVSGSLALQYFAKKGQGQSLDIIAQNAEIAMYGDWDSQNPRITEDDVIDFINENPRGINDFLNSAKKEKINALKTAFSHLTGLPANDKYLNKAIEQAKTKEEYLKNASSIELLTEEELVSLQQEIQQFEQQENGTAEKTNKTDSSRTGKPETENIEGNEPKSGVQSESRKNGSQQETDSGQSAGIVHDTSHDRVNALTTERIATEKRSPKAAPKKLNEIIKDVAKKLKANIIYSKGKRRNSLGSYNPSNAVVKIGRAGDLDTAAHEIGHFLDDSFDILGNIPATDELAIIKQLKWFSERGGSNPPSQLSPSKQAEYLEREGLAEFIRAYIANPAQAKLMAPELYSYFENRIGPETTKVLHEFSDDFIDFANADAGERLMSNVESLELRDKNGFIEWIKSLNKTKTGKILLDFNIIDETRAGFTNAMHHVEKAFIKMHEAKGIDVNDITKFSVDKNFNYLNSMYRTASSSIFNKMKYGLLDSKGKQIKDGDERVNIEYLFKGLDNTNSKTTLEDINDVVKLLIAQRTLEYAKKFKRTDNLTGIGGGITKDIDVAQEYLNEFNKLKETDQYKFDRITEGARRYRKFADSVLDIAVEKGLLSADNVADIRKVNQFYAALNRTKESAPTEELLELFKGSGNALNSVQAVITKAKGGTDFIQNPYTSLLINSANILKQGDKNQVLNSFFQPLKEMREMGNGAPIAFSEIAIPAVTGDKETITIYNEGTKEVWRITNKPIYEGLKSLNKVQDNFLLDLAAIPADLIRMSVTNHIVFGLRNAYRDTFARLTESRTNSGLSDFNYSKEDVENFRSYGGSQELHYLTDKKFHAKTIKEATQKLSDKGNIVLNPLKIAKAYGGFMSKTEEINRVAEFKSSFEYAKKKGLNDHEARLYAAYQAKDLMDFTRGGDNIRALNRIMPFLNAKVQGLSRAKNAIKENPVGFAFKQGVYMAVPTLIAALIRMQMDDDEEYEELPAYQKDLFWNFKTPFTGEAWISLPKPHELGLPSSVLDRAMSYGNGHKDSFDGFAGSASKTISIMDETSILGGFKPFIEVISNKDFFRDKNIIPSWEQDLMVEKRGGTKYASNIGKGFSKVLKEAGWTTDPRNIDHVLKGYGTYFADWAMATGDIGEENSRNKFGISKTGFAKDQAIYNSKSVMAATELAKELGKFQTKEFKNFKSKIETSYDMEEGPEKQNLIKEIYAQAQDLEKDYEKQKEAVLVHGEQEKELKQKMESLKEKFLNGKYRDNPDYKKAANEMKQLKETIKNSNKKTPK